MLTDHPEVVRTLVTALLFAETEGSAEIEVRHIESALQNPNYALPINEPTLSDGCNDSEQAPPTGINFQKNLSAEALRLVDSLWGS